MLFLHQCYNFWDLSMMIHAVNRDTVIHNWFSHSSLDKNLVFFQFFSSFYTRLHSCTHFQCTCINIYLRNIFWSEILGHWDYSSSTLLDISNLYSKVVRSIYISTYSQWVPVSLVASQNLFIILRLKNFCCLINVKGFCYCCFLK